MSDLFDDDPTNLDAQIAEVAREIRVRRKVYPRWITAGHISQTEASRQILVMDAVLTTLNTLRSARQARQDA